MFFSIEVEKIVMFERGSVVHSLVQFASVTDAKNARNNLHGANIYPDCCTVKVEYAKQESLNVRSNTERTKDYTVTVNGENNNVINGEGGKGKVMTILFGFIEIMFIFYRFHGEF